MASEAPKLAYKSADFSKKWDYLHELASTSQLASMLRYFAGRIADDYRAAINASLPKWRAGQTPIQSSPLEFWFNNTHDNLKFDGPYSDFLGLTFEIWKGKVGRRLNSLSGEIVMDKSDAETVQSDDRITIIVEPVDHSLNIFDRANSDMMIDQRFMYLNPRSVQYWRDVIEHHHQDDSRYETFGKCKRTLALSLKNEHLANLEYPIILGAGAPDKERMVFEKLLNDSDGEIPKACSIDASFFMLMHSFTEVEDLHDKIMFDLFCMDFLRTGAWRKLPTHRPRAVFFLLGGTVGNLHETEMFAFFRNAMRPGDIALIAGEFFSDLGELEAASSELLTTYNSDSVKDLVLSHLSDLPSKTLEGLTTIQKRELIEAVFERSEDIDVLKLRSEIEGTHSCSFYIKKNIEVGRNRIKKGVCLGTSKRYILENFVNRFSDECGVSWIETIGDPAKERFSHLIFEKRHP